MALRTPTGRSAWVWSPAGSDELLARACNDIAAGRFGLAAQALSDSRADYDLRGRRSALLASSAAEVDAAEHWLTESPRDPDALLLAARTAVVRARRALARGLDAGALTEQALRLCWRAAQQVPQDPTPVSALMMLRAAIGNPQRFTIAEGYQHWAERTYGSPANVGKPWGQWVAEALSGARHTHRAAGGRPYLKLPAVKGHLESLLATGPWDLMFEVWARDALCREAYAWFLECLHVNDAHEFAMFVRAATPPAAAVQLLPLEANLAEYRRRISNGPVNQPEDGAFAVWNAPWLRSVTLHLFMDWFGPLVQAQVSPPVREFSLLAHALYLTDEQRRSAVVFDAMKPFACAYPWSLTAPDGDGERAFLAAAEHLGVSAPRRMSPSEAEARYG